MLSTWRSSGSRSIHRDHKADLIALVHGAVSGLPLCIDKSTAGEAVHNDPVEEVGEDYQPEVVSLSPEGNMLSDEFIARVTLHDKVHTLTLSVQRSQQLQEQLHLIRDLHEQALLAQPIEPASIDRVHARNARQCIEEY